MKKSISDKLEALSLRYEELSVLLGDADVVSNREKFTKFSKEYAELRDVVTCFRSYKEAVENLTQAQAMLQDDDLEMREMAKEEVNALNEAAKQLETDLELLLLPKDPDDEKGVYIEVRAGTGGDEAAIFAGDLSKMYTRYAQVQGWQVEVVSTSDGDHGGYKEIILLISGQGVYGKLKFESGGHRVQRVPVTESQGRIHTSACTIAIMPQVAAVEQIDINPADLRIDTYRASGAGGQHINKTDSAVRITHLPTNTVVECQDERSQHKNKAKALSLLQSRLFQSEKDKQSQAEALTRKLLVGSGDRSERIRTYNFPQGRLTDHRINLTLYKLEECMAGDLGPVIEPLMREYQAEQLASLSGDDAS